MEQMETMETRERTGAQAAGHDFIEVSHLKRYFPIRRQLFNRPAFSWSIYSGRQPEYL